MTFADQLAALPGGAVVELGCGANPTPRNYAGVSTHGATCARLLDPMLQRN